MLICLFILYNQTYSINSLILIKCNIVNVKCISFINFFLSLNSIISNRTSTSIKICKTPRGGCLAGGYMTTLQHKNGVILFCFYFYIIIRMMGTFNFSLKFLGGEDFFVVWFLTGGGGGEGFLSKNIINLPCTIVKLTVK